MNRPPSYPRAFVLALVLLAAVFLLWTPSLAFAAPTGGISGAVTDASGNPLAGIDVVVYEQYAGYGWGEADFAETDEFGSYEVTGLPAGTYRVGFEDSSGSYLRQYYQASLTVDAATDVTVTAGFSTPGVDAVLLAGAQITGTVRDETGTALGRIDVTLYEYDATLDDWVDVAWTQTDVSGAYRLGGDRTGYYYVGFEDTAGSYLPEFYDNAASLWYATDVLATVGTARTGIDAVLTVAGHIAGTVKDSGGSGIGDVDVTVYRWDEDLLDWTEAGWTMTDSSGTYSVGALSSGNYRVGFNDSSGAYHERYFDGALTLATGNDVAVTAGATTGSVDATLPQTGHLTGTVVDSLGAPVPLVGVTVYYFDTDAKWHSAGYDLTDSSGHYFIAGLDGSYYRLGFRPEDPNCAFKYYPESVSIYRATNFPVRDGNTVTIDTTLAAASHITGVVRDETGTILPDIDVIAYAYDWYYGWYRTASTVSTESGGYDLGTLPGATYRLEFADEAGHHLSEFYEDELDVASARDVTVAAGEVRPSIDATLQSVLSDAYEPDNDAAHATPASGDGTWYSHTLYGAGDRDFHSFDATAATTYTMETSGTTDTHLLVYSQDSTTPLAQDDDSGPGLNARLEWAAPATGHYFFEVRHYDPTKGGIYDVRITAGIEPDQYEPDNSQAQARPASKDGTPYAHTFSMPTDNDYLSFEATAGMTYKAEVIPIDSDVTFEMAMENATSSRVDSARTPGVAKTMWWFSRKTERVYLRATKDPSDPYGRYQMRVTESAPPSGTVEINGGASITNSRTLTITSNIERATRMDLHVLDAGGSYWYYLNHPFEPTTTLTVNPGDGTIWITGYYDDPSGNSCEIGKTIYLDTQSPSQPTSLTASSGFGYVQLAWHNPLSDFASTRIVRSQTGFATSSTDTTDQAIVYEGTGTSKKDTGLLNGRLYYYSAFARDSAGNWSIETTTVGRPLPYAVLSQPWLVPVSPLRMSYFTVYGYVKPRHSGYTRLYFYRYLSGKWRLYRYRYARDYNYSTYTRYSLKYRLAYSGRWLVKAYHPPDANHLATWSRYRIFTVR